MAKHIPVIIPAGFCISKQYGYSVVYKSTFATITLLVCTLFGCQLPHHYFEEKAVDIGLQPSIVATDSFLIKVYRNQVKTNKTLHIYLTGDGTPWLKGVTPATDPTPNNAITLELISHDSMAAYIVGRPCYHGMATSEQCNNLLWTQKRYSPEIVESIAQAINKLIVQESASNVKLFGYSGGGTLAVLVAEQLLNVTAIVTVAANLDTDLWTKHHHLLPLKGSLNPATQPTIPTTITQLHYVGRHDQIVPIIIVNSYHKNHPNSRVIIIENFDHKCCWSTIWPQIITNQ